MDGDLEKRFAMIAETAISAAEGVKCGFADFIEGLETIVEGLQARLAFAREEHNDHTEKGGEG